MTSAERQGVNPAEQARIEDHKAKLLNGDIIAVLILESQLANYQIAGSASDFEIRVAENRQGRNFTIRQNGSGVNGSDGLYLSTKPLPKGFIAIEIEKPETDEGHAVFWDTLRDLNGLPA